MQNRAEANMKQLRMERPQPGSGGAGEQVDHPGTFRVTINLPQIKTPRRGTWTSLHEKNISLHGQLLIGARTR